VEVGCIATSKTFSLKVFRVKKSHFEKKILPLSIFEDFFDFEDENW